MRLTNLRLVFGLALLTMAACGENASRQAVVATTEIGADGGSISLGAITVEVPAGTLGAGTTLSVRFAVDHPEGNTGPAYEIDAGGAALLAPVTIAYKVDSDDLPEGTALADVRLAFAADGAWQPLPSCNVDVPAGVVRCETTHFSTWGAVPPLPPLPCSTTADCPEKECMVASCDGGGCAYAADPACSCTPDCAGKECGDDGCGGDCGGCGENQVCSPTGKCECQFLECMGTCCTEAETDCDDGGCCEPYCGDSCYDDSCIDPCGGCPEDAPICQDGECVAVCKPDCAGKECDDDGCGGSCGECEPGLLCVAGACVAGQTCDVWDYITPEELDAVGQCYMDAFPASEPLFPAIYGQGHLFKEDLDLDGEFFLVETAADQTAVTLTAPCVVTGLEIVVWSDVAPGGLEEGMPYALTDPSCLSYGSCDCETCIFAQASLEGKPSLDAVAGTVMFGCDPKNCDCGVMSYSLRLADLTFADIAGEKQFINVHSDGPDWLPKDEWLQTVTSE